MWKAYCAPKKAYVAIKIMDLEKITTSFEDIRVRLSSCTVVWIREERYKIWGELSCWICVYLAGGGADDEDDQPPERAQVLLQVWLHKR